MGGNQSNKLEIWGYDFQGIENSFKTKGALGSTHGMEYHSAAKSTATHDITADSEGCIRATPITWHCRKRQNQRDRASIWLLDRG